MNKQVCIIGGTGFVGRAIARQAVAAGHQVTVTTRHPERAGDMRVAGVQVKAADIVTGKGLNEAIQGSDCVINLVGLLFEHGVNSFQSAHVEGVQKIVKACEQEGVSQLLHMSALLHKDAANKSVYAKTKLQAEEIVKQSNLQWAIFRPSIIFGVNDSFLMRFKSLSSFGPFLPVIAGDTKFQPIWVEDVAKACVACIGNPKANHQTYILAGDKVFTFKEMLTLWMQALGRERTLISVPSFAASILAKISKLLPAPLITGDQLQLLAFDNIAEGEAYPETFGQTTSFETLLPMLAEGGQVGVLQHRLDAARAHSRKS